jgi:acyl-CoA synthetase (AMP-forming)/AMP-acid ligase II
VTGGAPISRDNLLAMRRVAPAAEIRILYGSTEVEPMTEIDAREAIRGGECDDPEIVEEGVNVGRFVQGLRFRFLKMHRGPITVASKQDWHALEAPPGAVGELVVSGEQVCRSYYNNPQADAQTKIRDHDGAIWHRTGDLGRCDGEGNLWIVGRVHNVIQRGGECVFPVRAEIILKKLPFVRSAAYLGLPDPALGERTVCVIVPHEASKIAGASQCQAWRREAHRILEKNGVPADGVVFRDEIPLDARHHSKVEYAALRELLLNDLRSRLS